MSLSAKIRRAPMRAATGAYILNSGIDKIRAGEDQLKGVHGFAAGAYPAVEKVDPKIFTRSLGVVEVSLGAALLLPVVPPLAAGVGLVAFSGGLLGMYWRTPSLHRSATDPRPTQDGVAVAKDSWLFGIGLGLVTDALLSPARDKQLTARGELSKVAAVRTERARGRRREAKARARELRANARALKAQAGGATATSRSHAGEYAGAVKGMATAATGAAKGAAGAAKGATQVAHGAAQAVQGAAQGAASVAQTAAHAAQGAAHVAKETTQRVVEHIG